MEADNGGDDREAEGEHKKQKVKYDDGAEAADPATPAGRRRSTGDDETPTKMAKAGEAAAASASKVQTKKLTVLKQLLPRFALCLTRTVKLQQDIQTNPAWDWALVGTATKNLTWAMQPRTSQMRRSKRMVGPMEYRPKLQHVLQEKRKDDQLGIDQGA